MDNLIGYSILILLSGMATVIDGQTYVYEDPGPEICADGITQAITCTNNAISKAKKYECDWEMVIPAYQACCDMATYWCPYYVQESWQIRVRQFNETLQATDDPDMCSNPCLNYVGKQEVYLNCTEHVNSGLERTVSAIIAADQADGNYTVLCNELSEIIACMTNSVMYCDPLIDDMNQTLQDPQARQAEQICEFDYQVDKIVRASGQQGNDTIGENSDDSNKTDTRLIIIIVVCCILAIVFINIIVICVCMRERRARRLRQDKEWEDATNASTIPPFTTPLAGGYY